MSMSCMKQYHGVDRYICCKQESFKILKTELLETGTQRKTEKERERERERIIEGW